MPPAVLPTDAGSDIFARRDPWAIAPGHASGDADRLWTTSRTLALRGSNRRHSVRLGPRPAVPQGWARPSASRLF
eukprot:4633418-Pyramimonas_sp.AAC.1